MRWRGLFTDKIYRSYGFFRMTDHSLMHMQFYSVGLTVRLFYCHGYSVTDKRIHFLIYPGIELFECFTKIAHRQYFMIAFYSEGAILT